MASTKHDDRQRGPGARALLVPAMWIAALLVSYLVLADWQNLPNTISSALGAI